MADAQGGIVRILDQLGVTPNGKVINYVKKENASIRFIEFGSGGELPKGLQGGFSSVHAARQAVESYLKSLEATPKKASAKK